MNPRLTKVKRIMVSATVSKPAGVKRIVFKEAVEGDFRKFQAMSNDSDSGGGARDIRFRPHDKFDPIFERLFPNQTVISGAMVRAGEFFWKGSGGAEESAEARYWPPTKARPGEGRVATVHKYPPFEVPQPTDKGRVVVLLVQRDDDKVWPEFATEDDLRSGAWSDAVSQPILRSLDANRREDEVARGFIDFETGEEFTDA